MSRVLQWVLAVGIDSKVLVITASTCLSVIDRGSTRRGSSSKPSKRFTRKRSRHLQTVAPVICSFLVTAPSPTTLIAAEHNASAHCHGLLRFRATSQHREFFSFLSREVEWFGGASDTHASV